jgi:signal transduction histidine kinase/DNA-binding NarL/FixJ family response regulator
MMHVIMLVVLLSSVKLSAQSNLDSLWNVWSSPTEHVSHRLSAINELAWNGYLFLNPDSAYHLASLQYSLAESVGSKEHMANALRTQGMSLAVRSRDKEAMVYLDKSLMIYRENDIPKGVACIYNAFGNIFKDQARYDKALEYFNQSNEIFFSLDDKNGIADTYENLGNVYFVQGDWDEALDYFSRALMLYEESGNLRGKASIYGCLGSLHEFQDDPQKAIEYYQKSISIYQFLGDNLGLASILNLIGNVNTGTGDYENAFEYFKKSLELNEQMDVGSGIAYCYNNMGVMYECRGDYEGALEFARKGLKISEEINFISLQAGSLSQIGGIHYKQGDYRSALEYSTKSLEMAKEFGIAEHIMHSSETLYKTYKALGSYEKALEMHELYTGMQDSIMSEEMQRAVIRQEYQFTYQKEALADSIAQVEKEYLMEMAHQEEISRQNRARNIILVTGILILLVSGGLWSRNRWIRKANARLAQEKERAERSEKFKQQFLANMSHEIRTPMNAVLGMTNLALDTDLNDKQRDYLQAIRKSSLNLLIIINDILDLSKLEAGKMDIERTPFRLREIIAQVYDTLKFKAEEKGLAFETWVESNIPDVLIGDPLRLNQVLLNLAGNAVKFTEKGSVRIEVTVIKGSVSKLMFKIIDTGIGIPPEKLDKLFKSFQQMDVSTSRKYGGTGLGLSISKSLVEMQHGHIKAQSQPGKGSEFSFSIPYGVANEEQSAQLNKEQEIDISALSGIRILLAEDNEYNRIVVNDTLLNHIKDIRIDHAENGRIAVEKLREADYDVILMDANMPEMSGLEATRKIREEFEAPRKDIPVIALSANVLNDEVQAFLDAGMNSCLPKPFTRKELISTLGKYYYNEEAVAKSRIQDPAEKNEESGDEETALPKGQVTDLEFLRNFCNNDRERMRKYIGMYLESAPENLKKIRGAMKKQDYSSLKVLVHSIKPHFQYMGMLRTRERADEIESLLSEGLDGVVLKDLVNLVGEDYRVSIEELSEIKI